MIERGRPRGVLKFFLRFPVLVYRVGLGGILGKRFLLLMHTGRKTGNERRAVVEVMRHDEISRTYIVAAAWGEESDWYRNLKKNPAVRITVGRATSDRRAEVLTPSAGADEFLRYAQRYPTAFRTLTRTLTGNPLPATLEACRTLGRSIPVVAFRPM